VADSTYIIDIASEMPDGGATTAQLDELSRSLISAGASAETLEAATLQVSAQLRAAGEASKAANAALAEGNARYGELERAALNAAKAAERAAQQGKLDPAMARTAHEAAQAVNREAVALRGLETAAAQAARAESRLVATQGNLRRMSSSAAGAFSEQAAAAKKSIREAEGFSPLVKKFNDMGDALSTSSGAAIIAVGAFVGVSVAVVALTAAAVAATAAIAAWGVSLASAKREAQITEEAVAALHPELAALSPAFAAISAETGASAQDLRAWKKQLDSAKVAADDIPESLRAMAMQEAALGKGGSAEFLEQLKETKRAARDVAKEVNSKLGGLVAKRMMGLDAQSAKLKKNFGDLFSGLNIDPVLEGMRVLVDLFDKGTASGQAMQFLFETVFQPIIDQAKNAAFVVEAFVLGFLIGLTKLYIAIKPAIKAVTEFFGFEDTSLADVLAVAKDAGEIAAFVFVGFIAILGALGVAIAGAIVWLAAIPFAIGLGVAAVIDAGVQIIQWVIGTWTKVTDFLNGLVPGMGEVATAIMQGLIGGIVNAGPAVVNAMIGVAKGAINAAKSVLGIASPSKVFADIGGYTGEGFAEGVDDSAGMAQDAMAAMVEPPDAGAAGFSAMASGAASGGAAAEASAAPGARGRAGGPTINFNAPVYFGGKQASASEVEDLVELITKTLEGDAAAVAGEAAA
jgi:hypothetical protein